jgi:hypothetical protein
MPARTGRRLFKAGRSGNNKPMTARRPNSAESGKAGIVDEPRQALSRMLHRVLPTGRRSADFQSAVSRISNPQTRRTRDGLPTGSRRHSRFGNPLPLGFDARLRGAPGPSACPGGTSDNSPTFQRWVGAPKPSRVPKGRLSGGPMSAVPSGLVGLCLAKPNVETLGYYHASLRDEPSPPLS